MIIFTSTAWTFNLFIDISPWWAQNRLPNRHYRWWFPEEYISIWAGPEFPYFYYGIGEAPGDSLSMPPDTQIILSFRPLLYFRFPRQDLSISTTMSSPLIGSWLQNQFAITLEQRFIQSTLVRSPHPRFSKMASWFQFFTNQWFIKHTVSEGGTWAPRRNVSSILLMEEKHCFSPLSFF